MKYITPFLLGLAVALFLVTNKIYPFNDKPEKPAEQVAAETQKEQEESAKRIHDAISSNITTWVDTEHQVMCYVYRDGYGTGSVGGISCLPRGQVTNFPSL